jgi:hypothetical protein
MVTQITLAGFCRSCEMDGSECHVNAFEVSWLAGVAAQVARSLPIRVRLSCDADGAGAYEPNASPACDQKQHQAIHRHERAVRAKNGLQIHLLPVASGALADGIDFGVAPARRRHARLPCRVWSARSVRDTGPSWEPPHARRTGVACSAARCPHQRYCAPPRSARPATSKEPSCSEIEVIIRDFESGLGVFADEGAFVPSLLAPGGILS